MPLFDALQHAATGTRVPRAEAVAALAFDAQGLVPVIAQQHDTGEVLMFAWMNRESLALTLASGEVTYYSRSRRALWRKGETSGQVQRLVELRIDCDGDALLARVDQHGAACHTGRRSCFYVRVDADAATVTDEVLVDPGTLYGNGPA
jgi:phosphoribosyl-AMP cyclohydrolase